MPKRRYDFTEYQPTGYDIYNAVREGNPDVSFHILDNRIAVHPESRSMTIEVDDAYEVESVSDFIGRADQEDDDAEFDADRRADNRAVIERYSKKFDITFRLNEPYDSYREPLNNAFSGLQIDLSLGEGILDFCYADFAKGREASRISYMLFSHETWDAISGREHSDEAPRTSKIKSHEDLVSETYFRYVDTMSALNELLYCSLYSAIFPPVFYNKSTDALKRYFRYLTALRKEYLELIEFCFDDSFYPDVLGALYPSERYYWYRSINDLPIRRNRREVFEANLTHMSGNTMPFGMEGEEVARRLNTKIPPTERHKEFAEKFNLDLDAFMTGLQIPRFISASYECGTVSEVLELEFTKVLEQNIRFRRCKRCGRYFIMKGNYNTEYCDRVAEGETRNCQALAAQENYRRKTADNSAIQIYNRFYKRYAARVKAGTILPEDFKRWKYEAVTKRELCADKRLSEEDFIAWLESCFTNRNRKHKA